MCFRRPARSVLNLCRYQDVSGPFVHLGPEILCKESEGCIAAVGGDHCGGEFVQEFDECLLEFFGCFAAGSNNVCDPVCDLGVESFFTCDESSVEGDVDTGGEVLGPIGKSVPVQFPVMCVCFLFCDI